MKKILLGLSLIIALALPVPASAKLLLAALQKASPINKSSNQ
jgi:hypothetical protein